MFPFPYDAIRFQLNQTKSFGSSSHQPYSGSSTPGGTTATTNSTAPTSSSSGSTLPLGQPAIRMTDSTSGPNGPNLKFAALSVESYHLDSPPFTGAAGGPGGYNMDQLDEAGRHLVNGHGVGSTEARNGSPSSGAKTIARTRNGGDGYNQIEQTMQAGSSNAARQAGTTSAANHVAASGQRSSAGGASQDRDVPPWNLDSRRGSQGESSQSHGRADTINDDSMTASSGYVPYTSRPETERPLHTQLTADADGIDLMSQHEPDQEVDGDGIGYVLGGSRGQDGSVPVQSQKKVSRPAGEIGRELEADIRYCLFARPTTPSLGIVSLSR